MSEQTKDGGAAFPIPLDDRPGAYPAEPGMSLRDYLAAKALAGLCANPGGPFQSNAQNGWGIVNCERDDVADLAYRLADAMLRARSVLNKENDRA